MERHDGDVLFVAEQSTDTLHFDQFVSVLTTMFCTRKISNEVWRLH